MASFVALAPARSDLVVYSGRNISRAYTLSQAGVAIDLSTVSTIVGQVRDGEGGTLLLSLTGAVTDAAGGAFTLSATAAATATYVTPKAVWEVVVTFADAVQTTILRGSVTVQRAIVA